MNRHVIVSPSGNLVDHKDMFIKFFGIDEDIINGVSISMELVIIPPNASDNIPPHRHTNCDTAIFIFDGEGITLYGELLEFSSSFKKGDFIYIPKDLRHQPKNTGNIDIVSIIARNTGKEKTSE